MSESNIEINKDLYTQICSSIGSNSEDKVRQFIERALLKAIELNTPQNQPSPGGS